MNDDINLMDIHERFMKQRIPIPIHYPTRYVTITTADHEEWEKKNKWERRRDKLVYKLKVKNRNLHILYKWLIMIPCVLIVLGAVCFLAVIMYTPEFYPITSIMCGLLSFFLATIIYDFVSEKIHTETNYLTVKHKGKVYR